MDAILALIFVVGGVIAFVTLFIAVWFTSLSLLFRPSWVATRIVQRFWPERPWDPTCLPRYRVTGALALVLALFVTWELIAGLLLG